MVRLLDGLKRLSGISRPFYFVSQQRNLIAPYVSRGGKERAQETLPQKAKLSARFLHTHSD